jgi:putative YhdH/YhfP family quinone oxidoreductase
MQNKFSALVVRENEDGKFSKKIETLSSDFLPKSEVTVEVKYSSLNYKDALSASGNKGITKKYPHIPGIDVSGIVIESASDKFQAGDEVIVTGRDLGMNTFGGFSEFISVPADWVISRPEKLSLKEAMMIGTSGFTAAIGVKEILNTGIAPEDGKILVTGATGAVGSAAISILAKLGFSVIASSGKPAEKEHLLKLGAKEVIDRNELVDNPAKALLSKRWRAAFDTVGGPALSYILKTTADQGIVTNCGMIGSPKLETSIMPFIIRGVRLVGIAAADTCMKERLNIWNLLSTKFKFDLTDEYCEEITLAQLPDRIDTMLAGGLKKKVLISMGK